MCTAITFQGQRHFFGRNLDLNITYQEAVTVTPRSFPLPFRHVPELSQHLAMIGMATVSDGFPLYYEATNEAGLSMAGLNFPGNAVYLPPEEDKDNLAPFELIPWILGQCKTVPEAAVLLDRLNVTDTPFSDRFPNAPLHWILADSTQSLVLEPTAGGLRIYPNPYGVLTNNPPFPYHAENVAQYLQLTSATPQNRLAPQLPLTATSLGVGAVGLPGDLSSPSRFVRGVFTKWNAQNAHGDDLCQCFHILEAVAFTAGCVQTQVGSERTVYSCVCDTAAGVYYYTTYTNRQITAVDLRRENPDADTLFCYPMAQEQQILFVN